MLREGVDLVLLEQVGGEAVGVDLGFSFGRGKQVDLAMGLLEGLGDLALLEPAPPVADGVGVGFDRVPEGHHRVVQRRPGLTVNGPPGVIVPGRESGLPRGGETPDQTPGTGGGDVRDSPADPRSVSQEYRSIRLPDNVAGVVPKDAVQE